jgi:hypothetical protein
MALDPRLAMQQSQELKRLEQRIALLEKVLAVQAAGSSVTLRSTGTMRIEASGPLVIKGATVDIN